LTGLVPRTPQAEEEAKTLEEEGKILEEEDRILKEEGKILKSYLKGMKIEEDRLTLPPVSERPDGFDLFHQRRSRRRIYEYVMDDEKFTLLISKYQQKTVDAAETEASDFDDVDIDVLF